MRCIPEELRGHERGEQDDEGGLDPAMTVSSACDGPSAPGALEHSSPSRNSDRDPPLPSLPPNVSGGSNKRHTGA